MQKTNLKRLPRQFPIPGAITSALALQKPDINPFLRNLCGNGKYMLRTQKVFFIQPIASSMDANFLDHMFKHPEIFGKGKLMQDRSKMYLGYPNAVSAEYDDPFYAVLMEHLHEFANAGALTKLEDDVQKMIDDAFDKVDLDGGFIPDISLFARHLVGQIGTVLLLGQDLSHYIPLIDHYFELGSKGKETPQFLTAKQELFEVCRALIAEERVKMPKAGKVTNILQVMIRMEEDKRIVDMISGGEIDPDWIVWNVITFFVALADTTRTTMAGGMVKLASNPEAMESIFQESSDPVTYKSLKDQKGLQSFVEEVLRYFASAAVTLRQTLQASEYRGYDIPTNLIIAMPIADMMRLDENFGDGDKFIWNRHKPEEQQKRTYNRVAFKPFGGGSRICWGWTFATIILAKTFKTANRRYKSIKVVTGAEKSHYIYMTTKYPLGVSMQLTAR